ncbi:four helix bundle protein [Desulfothermus naphthae]
MEFIQFFYIRLGSLTELETQMIISSKSGYISSNNRIFSQIEILRRKTH